MAPEKDFLGMVWGWFSFWNMNKPSLHELELQEWKTFICPKYFFLAKLQGPIIKNILLNNISRLVSIKRRLLRNNKNNHALDMCLLLCVVYMHICVYICICIHMYMYIYVVICYICFRNKIYFNECLTVTIFNAIDHFNSDNSVLYITWPSAVHVCVTTHLHT